MWELSLVKSLLTRLTRPVRRVRGNVFASDTRGQSVMVGMMLLLMIVSSVYVIAQVQWAPALQQDTETRHAQQQLTDMQELQADMVTVSSTGERRSQTVSMGTAYPFRGLLLHPADPSTQAFTSEDLGIKIRNVEAFDESADEFLGGGQAYSSVAFTVNPRYNEYTDAGKLRIEHGVLVNDFQDHQEVVSYPSLISGRDISLITLQGDMRIGRPQSTAFELDPLSASEETVVVEDNGSPIEIEIETRLSKSEWRDILSDEIRTDPSQTDRFIDSISFDDTGTPNTLTIKLVPGEQYRLNLAKVGIRHGDEAAFPPSMEPDEAYLTSLVGTEHQVDEGQTVDLSGQVRDRFHNPKSTVVVEAKVTEGDGGLVAEDGSVENSVEYLTDNDGDVEFVYVAPTIEEPTDEKESEDVTVTMKVKDKSGNEWTIEYEIEVRNIG